MLKSEALGQLSAIADADNRDFEDFAAAYKTMEEVVKEYPELSHYVLPIVVQTAADKGFNADIRPAAARVFNAAALNLPAEDVVKNVVHAFKRCPPFAYYLMPDLLSGRPELSAALFPEAEAGLAKIEANCVYSAAAAAKAALLCASDREAAAMLDSAFRPAEEKEDFSRVLYRSLWQIYSRHPALKEQIFSLLETPRLLKPQNYDAFYSNLGQIGLFDAGERGRVIGLLSSYLQKGGNHQQRAKSGFVFKTLNKGNRGFAQSTLFGQFVLADTPVNSFLFEEFNHHVADMFCFVNFHEA